MTPINGLTDSFVVCLAYSKRPFRPRGMTDGMTDALRENVF